MDLDVVHVVQARFRLGSELPRGFQHAAGQPEQALCILVEAGRNRGVDGAMELEVFVGERVDRPGYRDQRRLHGVAQRLELL